MSDNRRKQRVEVLGQVRGGIDGLAVEITVRDMSLDGLGMESACAFPTGSVHDFRLTLGDGASVQVRGRVVRCQRVDTPGGGPRYLSGVRFVDEESQELSAAS